jgi:mannuronan 5-epimerase
MIASARLLGTALCFGLLLAAAGSILLAGTITTATITSAQVIDLPPPLLPLSPSNGTSSGSETEGAGGNATGPEEPVASPGNFTSPPPAEEEGTPAAGGNETSSEEGADDATPRLPILSLPSSSTNPCLDYDEELHMVYIICDADIYDLFAGLRDDSITQQLGSGEILINANITVNDGATFSINSDDGINYVKIADNNGITVLGAIHIDDIKITSWNPANNTVIHQDGTTGSVQRAYLFFSGSEGSSHIFNSELAYMGYNETGYRGLDLMHGSHDFAIVNSSFHHMWYAFFSNAAYNVTIDSSEYHDNHLYAIDPHTGTHNMTISNNTVYNNPIGLVCSLDCYDIIFERNTIYNNSGAGIFLSRNTHDSVARYNIIYGQPIGIGFSESSNNLAYGNNITAVGRGIFLNDPEVRDDGNTTNNRIYRNTISDSAVGIAALRATENMAADNIFNNITMSHYRVSANASLTIENQTFGNDAAATIIEGQDGQNNTVNFVNCGTIVIDTGSSTSTTTSYDTSLQQHAVTLSDQTIIMVSTAGSPR